MNFFDRLFGRAPPVTDAGGLADFIDAQSAFVAQKGIYEYSRARAGHYSKVLFAESGFQRAVEEARWRAYPLGLAMVGEIACVVLEQTSGEERQPIVRGVADLTLSVFDRYPVPAVLDAATWSNERAQLSQRLDRISLHPPKRAMDIPEPIAESYFALMPIHKSLRGQDFPTLKNYLIVTLCNVHHELTQRIDAKAVAGQLLARG